MLHLTSGAIHHPYRSFLYASHAEDKAMEPWSPQSP